MSDFEIESKNFENYLTVKGLSPQTLYFYMNYYSKWRQLVDALGDDFQLNQETINSFLLAFPDNVPCRAFLFNYLNFLKRKDLEIPKRTGATVVKKTTIITPQHLDMLRQYFYAKGKNVWLLFELSSSGALRRDEAVNIRMSDLNIEEVAYNREAPCKLLVRKGKGNKQRFVVLPRVLFKEISTYAIENNLGKDDRLFKMVKRTWWHHFHKACLDLGMTREETDSEGNKKIVALYHPHSLRHSKSTQWYNDGIDIVRIQQRLGHADIKVTRRYISPDEKKEESLWAKEVE